jgi:hypothetical protein
MVALEKEGKRKREIAASLGHINSRKREERNERP